MFGVEGGPIRGAPQNGVEGSGAVWGGSQRRRANRLKTHLQLVAALLLLGACAWKSCWSGCGAGMRAGNS